MLAAKPPVLTENFGPRDFSGKPLQVCMDNNFWYPYVFTYKKKPVGLHLELIDQATKNLGMNVDYKPMSWVQCIRKMKTGEVDAAISISHTPDREAFVDFPDDVNAPMSDWRLSQVNYYVITANKTKEDANGYVFKGNLRSLPQPVRVELGYSMVKLLKSHDLDILLGHSVIANMKDMLLMKSGSVITTKEVAESLAKKPQFRDKYTIHPKPIHSKSYFIGFSHKAHIPRRIQRRIWHEIKKLRQDKLYTRQLAKKYGY